MGWWYERRTVHSELNGVLKVVTKFGQTAVLTDAIFQSGKYMQNVFAGMLRMLHKDFAPKKILLLGLGAGSCVSVIRRQFPHAHLVAVEHDPVMLALAQETYLRHRDGRLEILPGSVEGVLPKLQTAFDLILIDLFYRRRVASCVTQPDVLHHINRLLAWRGFLIVNLFKEDETISPVIEQTFSLHRKRQVHYNRVALYRHWGMGKIGEGVPDGFHDKEQSLIYLRNVGPMGKRFSLIDDPGGHGTRLRVGPIVFDRFVQACEPSLEAIGKLRCISWQPYAGKPPRGWWRIPAIFTTHYKHGYAVFEKHDYWLHWSNHARRHRAKFLKDLAYEVVEVDLATFATAYHATKFLDPFSRRAFVGVLLHHVKRHPQDVHLTVARERNGGRVVSGLATIDYQDISLSTHMIAFIHPCAQHTSVGVGLIDHWHRRCLQIGLQFLDFGILRSSGDPRSWEGYTQFKRQFHLCEILYPQAVFRIVWFNKRV